MNQNPYLDQKGRKFTYGEFFPYELSLFNYNETLAQDYFPLTKEAVLERGFKWKEKDHKEYQPQTYQKPDDIKDVKGDILDAVLSCQTCAKNYRLIKPELDLLRRWNFPIPRKCFDCRHKERLARTNPIKFYKKQCAKCKREITTNFTPERKEIVYCEQCYQKEMV